MTQFLTAIILNGPPGCGKDTIAEGLVNRGFTHCMMKESLYAVTADFFKIDRIVFRELARNRVLKEVKTPLLCHNGKNYSPREALIYVSEEIYKPRYGSDYFGRLTARDCANRGLSRVVLSDGGFPEEVGPLLWLYEHVFIFRLYRDGFTFEGDSRDYLHGFDRVYDIELFEGKPELAVNKIHEIITCAIQDKMITA